MRCKRKSAYSITFGNDMLMGLGNTFGIRALGV